MTTIEGAYVLAAVCSAIASALAWLAKLRWSREFAQAKDETIKAKEAHIEVLKQQVTSLQEMSPMKIREYFVSVKQQLEEFIDALKRQLEAAQKEIAAKDDAIRCLQSEGASQGSRVVNLQQEKTIIERETADLQDKVAQLERKLAASIQFDPSMLEAARSSSIALAQHLHSDWAQVSRQALLGLMSVTQNTPLPLKLSAEQTKQDKDDDEEGSN
jgi:DNA repair exonuclease SbcCD ATPase subunit